MQVLTYASPFGIRLLLQRRYCSNCVIWGTIGICDLWFWKKFWRTNERPSVGRIWGVRALPLPARQPWPPGPAHYFLMSNRHSTGAPGEYARQLITHGKSAVPSKTIRHLKYLSDKRWPRVWLQCFSPCWSSLTSQNVWNPQSFDQVRWICHTATLEAAADAPADGAEPRVEPEQAPAEASTQNQSTAAGPELPEGQLLIPSHATQKLLLI